MVLRPCDSAGDILPVLSLSQMASGAEAVGLLVEDRLNLLTGDWWENPSRGCRVLELLRESRMNEGDLQALSSYLCSYIRETTGVQDVRDAVISPQGRQAPFSCRVETAEGTANINYELR